MRELKQRETERIKKDPSHKVRDDKVGIVVTQWDRGDTVGSGNDVVEFEMEVRFRGQSGVRNEKKMKKYLVDLHIHSLLSPCGSLEMSPIAIVDKAVEIGLDAIALTDHNSLRQVREIVRYGEQRGLKVFVGVEITTREEAHCIALLPDMDTADMLQIFIDKHIIKQTNNTEKLGDQVWVDADEQIEGEVEWYLNSPLSLSVDVIAREVKKLSGLFVPAHVDRPSYSLIGQLGFISPDLPIDALEFNSSERFAKLTDKGGKYLKNYSAYTASDAHFPHLIGTNPSWLYAEKLSFEELQKALAQQDGRKIISKLYDNRDQ